APRFGGVMRPNRYR
nr:Chain H, ALA-PRO-ARG-PHE-GLY-GLY-VAL-MET-ARG-PRO-ASN-ARG [synthetic construct]